MLRTPLAICLTVLAVLTGAWTTSSKQHGPTGTIAWFDAKQLVVARLDGTPVRRLRSRWQASFRLSPDASALAIVDRSLRILDLSTGAARTVVTATSVRGALDSVVFSPSGRYVAVSYGDARCKRLPGIVVVDLQTSTRSAARLWPRHAPWRYGQSTRFVDVLDVTDEGHVAFRETRYEFGECRYQALLGETVWRSTGADANPTRVVTDYEIGQVAWSPDGRWFAYTIGGGDACELWVANGSGRSRRLVARREYVRWGCSRGLSGIPVTWAPDGGTLYYADGSEVWAWDRTRNRHRAIVRPPGAPASNCELDQSCRNHDIRALSSDSGWLLLTQENEQTYRDVPYLISTGSGDVRTLRGPTPVYQPVSARLD